MRPCNLKCRDEYLGGVDERIESDLIIIKGNQHRFNVHFLSQNIEGNLRRCLGHEKEDIKEHRRFLLVNFK